MTVDTVKVSADTFMSVFFMSSAERKEFTQDKRPQADKPQKRTAEGVPLWSVTLGAINWRGKPDMITATVATFDNPEASFVSGQPVELAGLTFGVTAKRDGSGFVTWCSADSIASVSGARLKSAGGAEA